MNKYEIGYIVLGSISTLMIIGMYAIAVSLGLFKREWPDES